MFLSAVLFILPFSLLSLAVPAPISPDAILGTYRDGNCISIPSIIPLSRNSCYQPLGSVDSTQVIELRNGCQVWAFDTNDCSSSPAVLRPDQCVGPLGERNDVEGLMVQCIS